MTRMLRIAAVLAVGIALAATTGMAQTTPPQEYMDLARRLFAELIEINTTDSERGDNTVAAHAMADALLEAGFPEEDVHVLVPSDAPTKGNLVARYRGRDRSLKPILLLAHIDVVEALPEDWSPDLNPFEFLERDDYYYGRGVTDDKDEAAIYTANFIRMRREGFVPDRDIVLALTADEEGGSRNGVEFLLAQHRDLIDAAYALNEGGGGMERDGRKISNNVQAAEKKFLSFYFTATNPGGHSSLPVEKNAIYDLSQALLAVQAYAFPVMLHEVTEEFFGGSADLVGGEIGEAMRRIVANPADAQAAATLSVDPGYNSRLRTTCVATLLEARADLAAGGRGTPAHRGDVLRLAPLDPPVGRCRRPGREPAPPGGCDLQRASAQRKGLPALPRRRGRCGSRHLHLGQRDAQSQESELLGRGSDRAHAARDRSRGRRGRPGPHLYFDGLRVSLRGRRRPRRGGEPRAQAGGSRGVGDFPGRYDRRGPSRAGSRPGGRGER